MFTHLCMLAQPCIKMLSVPHIGWGGVDNTHWDPQHGGISWMPNDCNHMIIFELICAYTHLILIVLTILLWLICVIVPMLEFVNKLVYSMRHTEIPGGECHRHEKGFGKETMRFILSVIFGIFGMDAGRYTDEPWQFFCARTVVFPLK